MKTKQFNMKTKQLIKTIGCVVGIYGIFLSAPLRAQNVGINTTGTMPNAKAMLDVDVSTSGTKMGLLVPRMTTTERNSITAPIPESLLLYNTTTQCFEAWNQATGMWVAFGCIGCTAPPSPPSATAATSASLTTFTANWSLVSGATAYLLDVSASSTFTNFVSGYNGLNVGNALTSAVSSLTCGTTYYYRVRATNACGTSISSNTISVTPNCAIPTAGACGSQVWAATNLNVGTMIAGVTDQTNNGIVEKYCYNDLPANCTTSGGLYQWDEMMNYTSGINCDPCGSSGRQGICPTGYHVPTDLEWSRYEYCLESTVAPTGTESLSDFQTQTGFRGTTTGSKMKATSSNTSAWDGNNASGFNALPAGYRNTGGTFNSLGSSMYYWSATEIDASTAWYRYLNTGVAQSSRNHFNSKSTGRTVRCLQD